MVPCEVRFLRFGSALCCTSLYELSTVSSLHMNMLNSVAADVIWASKDAA
jgi:hypothetical protein